MFASTSQDGLHRGLTTQAVAFARMFMTKPAIKAGSERYLSLETIDISGKGGRGTLDEFLREESELVR